MNEWTYIIDTQEEFRWSYFDLQLMYKWNFYQEKVRKWEYRYTLTIL